MVCVRGDSGDRENDCHGVVNEILKLEYPSEPLKRLVLFTCEWYDPTCPRGTRKHNHYKIININHTKRYGNLIHLSSPKMQDKFITYHIMEDTNLTGG